MSDANATEINGTKLIAKKEGTTTIQAEYNGKYSQEQNVTVDKIIHGHRLPPEPDPKINNSTLLGIDSNHNGVRDDVERWIYETYKDKHPIYIDIAMQSGKAWQKVLEDPTQAKIIYPVVDAVTWCEGYYKIYAKYFNKPILIEESINNEYFRKNIVFNTNARLAAFNQYDLLLSGETYSTPNIDSEMNSYCDFNTSQYEH
jgi:hypothetical protein